MINWTFAGRELRISDRSAVTFEFAIGEVIQVGDVLVVLLNVPETEALRENVFGVSAEGKVIWQIQPVKETKSLPLSHYRSLRKYEGQIVRIYNSNRTIVSIGARTGEIIAWGATKEENGDEVDYAATQELYRRIATSTLEGKRKK